MLLGENKETRPSANDHLQEVSRQAVNLSMRIFAVQCHTEAILKSWQIINSFFFFSWVLSIFESTKVHHVHKCFYKLSMWAQYVSNRREFWHFIDFMKGKARSIHKMFRLTSCSSQVIKCATHPLIWYNDMVLGSA